MVNPTWEVLLINVLFSSKNDFCSSIQWTASPKISFCYVCFFFFVLIVCCVFSSDKCWCHTPLILTETLVHLSVICLNEWPLMEMLSMSVTNEVYFQLAFCLRKYPVLRVGRFTRVSCLLHYFLLPSLLSSASIYVLSWFAFCVVKNSLRFLKSIIQMIKNK